MFHKWNGESTVSFSSSEGDRQRSLQEYIMRITQVIHTKRSAKRLCDLSHIFKQGMTIAEK